MWTSLYVEACLANSFERKKKTETKINAVVMTFVRDTKVRWFFYISNRNMCISLVYIYCPLIMDKCIPYVICSIYIFTTSINHVIWYTHVFLNFCKIIFLSFIFYSIMVNIFMSQSLCVTMSWFLNLVIL